MSIKDSHSIRRRLRREKLESWTCDLGMNLSPVSRKPRYYCARNPREREKRSMRAGKKEAGSRGEQLLVCAPPPAPGRWHERRCVRGHSRSQKLPAVGQVSRAPACSLIRSSDTSTASLAKLLLQSCPYFVMFGLVHLQRTASLVIRKVIL